MLRMLPFYWLFIYAASDGLSQIQIVVKVTSGIRNVTFKDLVTFEDLILSIFTRFSEIVAKRGKIVENCYLL